MSIDPPVRIMRSDAERIEELRLRLAQRFAVAVCDIRVVRAPLRICPLGAHIDHQLGIVTGMTIDQSLLMAFAPTTDGTVTIESQNFDTPVHFSVADVPPYRQGDWGNYIRGAVLALQRENTLQRGMVGLIDSEMPVGGLSSSAAVTIAYLLALEAVNEIELAPHDNIALVSRTEQGYIGLRNGILDQTSILFSRPGSLTRIDCLDNGIDRVAIGDQQDDFEILVVYSGVGKSGGLVGTGYNSRVDECQEAARLLLAFAGETDDLPSSDPRLRHVDPAIFATDGHRLPETLRKRATHYFGEMQRVEEGLQAWRAGDMQHFGTLMTASGASSVDQYECGSPQLITLYDILHQTEGVYGARFSGAGFRGNCIALIDPKARTHIAKTLHQQYPEAHPDVADLYSIHFCQPAGAAEVL